MNCPNCNGSGQTGPADNPDSCYYCRGEGTIECLDGGEESLGCLGPIEYREPLSGTGRSFPRCERHWDERLAYQEELNARYPANPPSDWSPLDAGEHWDEDY